jgi:hypothetical protein
MKDFIVFYEHNEYGYYSCVIDERDIVSISDALNYFEENYSHIEVYGIMVKS